MFRCTTKINQTRNCTPPSSWLRYTNTAVNTAFSTFIRRHKCLSTFTRRNSSFSTRTKSNSSTYPIAASSFLSTRTKNSSTYPIAASSFLSTMIGSKPQKIPLQSRIRFFSSNNGTNQQIQLPIYGMNQSNLKILYKPSEFLETLISLAENATHKISLSALYAGSTTTEMRLLDTIRNTMRKRPNVKLELLFDRSRSLRGGHGSTKSTYDLCVQLEQEFGSRVQSRFFSPPIVQNSIIQNYLPSKLQETLGVQHIKFYAFDDNAILSGANLSHDYFTNRQDRYLFIQQAPEFVHGVLSLIDTVRQFCSTTNNIYTPTLRTWGQQLAFTQAMHTTLQTEYQVSKSTLTSTKDVYLAPLPHFGPTQLRVDDQVTHGLLQLAAWQTPTQSSGIHLSTGYFNLAPNYEQSLIHAAQNGCPVHILTAAPKANGFYGGKTPSSAIPQAYTEFERRFLYRCSKHSNVLENIFIDEFERKGWTFHAKGLWLQTDRIEQKDTPSTSRINKKTDSMGTFPAKNINSTILNTLVQNGGTTVLIGSPNFGMRSVNLDLELQCMVYMPDSNGALAKCFEQERQHLWGQIGDESHVNKTSLVDLETTDRTTNKWISWSNGRWIIPASVLCHPFF